MRRGAKSGRSLRLEAEGSCICVKCGYRASKKAGELCIYNRCPKCGTVLFSEVDVYS